MSRFSRVSDRLAELLIREWSYEHPRTVLWIRIVTMVWLTFLGAALMSIYWWLGLLCWFFVGVHYWAASRMTSELRARRAGAPPTGRATVR